MKFQKICTMTYPTEMPIKGSKGPLQGISGPRKTHERHTKNTRDPLVAHLGRLRPLSITLAGLAKAREARAAWCPRPLLRYLGPTRGAPALASTLNPGAAPRTPPHVSGIVRQPKPPARPLAGLGPVASAGLGGFARSPLGLAGARPLGGSRLCYAW